ncbi:hypothetical protein IE53DRAFT_158484 [Violaceomyces palustris]|uniref:Uncharacterized protein n=1 Tax=Violaceomyces palustris TaxID=1673888 RepID=A0ACD0P677_9BASI|nr:hypothetical protein IE53DRAFT_158484 [Violaceomyces palustris]
MWERRERMSKCLSYRRDHQRQAKIRTEDNRQKKRKRKKKKEQRRTRPYSRNPILLGQNKSKALLPSQIKVTFSSSIFAPKPILSVVEISSRNSNSFPMPMADGRKDEFIDSKLGCKPGRFLPFPFFIFFYPPTPTMSGDRRPPPTMPRFIRILLGIASNVFLPFHLPSVMIPAKKKAAEGKKNFKLSRPLVPFPRPLLSHNLTISTPCLYLALHTKVTTCCSIGRMDSRSYLSLIFPIFFLPIYSWQSPAHLSLPSMYAL